MNHRFWRSRCLAATVGGPGQCCLRDRLVVEGTPLTLCDLPMYGKARLANRRKRDDDHRPGKHGYPDISLDASGGKLAKREDSTAVLSSAAKERAPMASRPADSLEVERDVCVRPQHYRTAFQADREVIIRWSEGFPGLGLVLSCQVAERGELQTACHLVKELG
ncbi:hypothetical protein LZ30DRAFT_324174 [Colletotrichum cereale]|nr:hypothetical protein LZ30DRAFT_324174 [Colletotrichum cereale]